MKTNVEKYKSKGVLNLGDGLNLDLFLGVFAEAGGATTSNIITVEQAYGDGKELQKVFSLPEGHSTIMAVRCNVYGATYTDLLRFSAGKETSQLNFYTDNNIFFTENKTTPAIGGPVCIKAKISPLAPMGRYTFKVLYASCGIDKITWYENQFANRTYYARDNERLTLKIETIDEDAETTQVLSTDANGELDGLDLETYTDFIINTDASSGLCVFSPQAVVGDKIYRMMFNNDGELRFQDIPDCEQLTTQVKANSIVSVVFREFDNQYYIAIDQQPVEAYYTKDETDAAIAEAIGNNQYPAINAYNKTGLAEGSMRWSSSSKTEINVLKGNTWNSLISFLDLSNFWNKTELKDFNWVGLNYGTTANGRCYELRKNNNTVIGSGINVIENSTEGELDNIIELENASLAGSGTYYIPTIRFMVMVLNRKLEQALPDFSDFVHTYGDGYNYEVVNGNKRFNGQTIFGSYITIKTLSENHYSALASSSEEGTTRLYVNFFENNLQQGGNIEFSKSKIRVNSISNIYKYTELQHNLLKFSYGLTNYATLLYNGVNISSNVPIVAGKINDIGPTDDELTRGQDVYSYVNGKITPIGKYQLINFTDYQGETINALPNYRKFLVTQCFGLSSILDIQDITPEVGMVLEFLNVTGNTYKIKTDSSTTIEIGGGFTSSKAIAVYENDGWHVFKVAELVELTS